MGVGFRIGLSAINILPKNIFVHTCTNSPIQIHPPPSFAQRALREQHPPSATTDGRNDAHGYVTRRGLWNKKKAICRRAQRIWRIIPSTWRKNQGLGTEIKMRDTRLAYNTVPLFQRLFNMIIFSLILFFNTTTFNPSSLSFLYDSINKKCLCFFTHKFKSNIFYHISKFQHSLHQIPTYGLTCN